MAFEYQQLNEEYSLQYSPTPPPSYPQASLAPCFPSLPSRGRQSSLPELSQLTYSFPANNTNPYPQPPSYRFPESNHTTADNSCTDTSRNPKVQSHTNIAHPYARLYAKNDSKKRHRKIWNHTLEKALFNSHELSTMGAPHRRTIYVASLEAHVDRLHAQLLSIGLYPIPFNKLEPYKGLNSKVVKSMVAGLQNDASHIKLKLLELERSNGALCDIIDEPHATAQFRRHSVDSAHSSGASYL